MSATIEQATAASPHAASLRVRVQELAHKRASTAVIAATVKAKVDAFEAANAEELSAYKVARAEVDALEAEVKALAVLAYDALSDEAKKADGAKKVAPGVAIQDAPTYSITDRDAAFAWSKASTIGYIPESFDEAEVVNAAKKLSASLPFVSKLDGYKATLAKDLTAALAAVTS